MSTKRIRCEKETNYEDPKAGNFICYGRDHHVKSIKEFAESSLKGIYLLTGDRGVGKTQIVKEALNNKDPIFRQYDHKSRFQKQRVLPIWVDLSLLGLSSTVLGDNTHSLMSKLNKCSANQSNEKFDNLINRNISNISDQDFLKAIAQAISTQLSPHFCYKLFGKGLVTKIGFWPLLFGFYTTPPITKWAITKIFTLSLLFACLAALIYWGIDLNILKTPHGTPLTLHTIFISFIANTFKTFGNNFNWISFTILFFPILAITALAHRIKNIWVLKRIIKKVRAMAYADNYKTDIHSSKETTATLESILKIKPIFSSKKQLKIIFTPTVPYLLRKIEQLLFAYNCFGIQPLLVIDELDKLGAHRDMENAILMKYGKKNEYNYIWPDGNIQIV